jgi:hypothetical protein
MEECWKQDCPNWAGYLRNNCRAWWTELDKNCKDYLKAKTESGAQVPCTGGAAAVVLNGMLSCANIKEEIRRWQERDCT